MRFRSRLVAIIGFVCAPSGGKNEAVVSWLVRALPLSQRYRSLATATNEMKVWPQSKRFRDQCLVLHEDQYVPPRFDDGRGPIGVFAMLGENPEAKTILSTCVKVVDSFASEARDLCDVDVDRYVLKPTSLDSMHLTVSIVHEHPNMVPEEHRQNWLNTNEDGWNDRLVEEISSHHSRRCRSPLLQLDSLLWTPDGALIAGFVDETGPRFASLRQSSTDIASRVLGGKLTASRPKTLIHVTLGRFLADAGLGTDVGEEDLLEFAKLARTYNEEILPALVQKVSKEDHKGHIRINKLSLVRNLQMLMYDFETYGTWTLRRG